VPRRLRPIGHDEKLSIVDHLDELRARLIVCIAALLVAFGACFWQNHALLGLLNRALPTHYANATNHLNGLTSDSVSERGALLGAARVTARLAHTSTFAPTVRAQFAQLQRYLRDAATALPAKAPKELPVTLGVGESFTTTITVVAYFALLISLPVLIYEIYAFVIPALNPNEARVVKPVMVAAPLLFIGGAVFTFFMVLPPAVHFLQGYNSKDFQILVQANSVYKFEILTMMGIGLAFEVPLFLAGLQRIGVVNGRTLTGHWRYAALIIAVVTAALPGVDPVTMFFEMLPLVVLYLASIVLLKWLDRRDARRAALELTRAGPEIDLTA
jgi:sec-independent protein translocase protein TatC